MIDFAGGLRHSTRRSGQRSFNSAINTHGLTLYPPVAQLDRALPSGGRGQRFESSRAGHIKKKPTFASVFCFLDCAVGANLQFDNIVRNDVVPLQPTRIAGEPQK